MTVNCIQDALVLTQLPSLSVDGLLLLPFGIAMVTILELH